MWLRGKKDFERKKIINQPPLYPFYPHQLSLVILMVACIHAIEAYGLNPAIYSAHLKLHPLLVLAVLVVAEHSLGVWGLLLAVPLTVFVLDYAIRYPACTVIGVAERELTAMTADDEDETAAGGGGGATPAAPRLAPPAEPRRLGA